MKLSIKPALAPGATGLARQEQLGGEVAGDGTPRLLAWRSLPALVVGPQDKVLPRFAEAEAALAREGWPVLRRRGGGGACPIAEGTLQIALAAPATERGSIDRAYQDMAERVSALLGSLGLSAEIGRIEAAFCPGRYDVALGGRKLCGISQHWRRHEGQTIVTVGASLIVDEEPERIAAPVNRFYRLAGGQAVCLAEAITSLRLASGGADIACENLMARLLDRLPAAASPPPAWSY